MRFLSCVSILLISFAASATTLARIEVSELFKEADVVVIVRVAAGQTLGEGEERCGAIYTGKIERAFKGAAGTETVQFGHYPGYEAGGRYLLFLTKPGRRFDPLNSTNSESMAIEQEFRARCDSKQTGHRVMHSGVGALRIALKPQPTEPKGAILVPSRYLTLPKSVARLAADAEERQKYSDPVWIAEHDFVRYLETLAQRVSATPDPSAPPLDSPR